MYDAMYMLYYIYLFIYFIIRLINNTSNQVGFFGSLLKTEHTMELINQRAFGQLTTFRKWGIYAMGFIVFLLILVKGSAFFKIILNCLCLTLVLLTVFHNIIIFCIIIYITLNIACAFSNAIKLCSVVFDLQI